jgi:hypothetical protein
MATVVVAFILAILWMPATEAKQWTLVVLVIAAALLALLLERNWEMVCHFLLEPRGGLHMHWFDPNDGYLFHPIGMVVEVRFRFWWWSRARLYNAPASWAKVEMEWPFIRAWDKGGGSWPVHCFRCVGSDVLFFEAQMESLLKHIETNDSTGKVPNA